MSRTILGLTGVPGSGKDAVGEYLKHAYGASVHMFSTPLRDLLTRLHLPIIRQNLAMLSGALRQIFGNDLFGKVMLKDIVDDEHTLIVATGIRREEDVETLKAAENFHLLFVAADPEIRYQRIHVRGQNQDDATKTYEEFLKEEELETERTITPLKAHVEHVIENNGSLEELHRKLDAIMAEYGFKKS